MRRVQAAPAAKTSTIVVHMPIDRMSSVIDGLTKARKSGDPG